MDKVALLEKWQKLVDPNPTKPWTDKENLLGYFSNFRPNGDRVDEVFKDHLFGNQILLRLQSIYEATKHAKIGQFGYFLVEDPPKISNNELLELVHKYVKNVQELTKLAGEPVYKIIKKLTNINFPQEHDQNEESDVDTEIIEGVYDYLIYKRTESPLLLLRDGYYSIANDFFLAFWVSWPLYESNVPIVDPFEPYFELWKHGYQVNFDDNERDINIRPYLS